MENSYQGNELSNPTEWEKWTLNVDDDDDAAVQIQATSAFGSWYQ